MLAEGRDLEELQGTRNPPKSPQPPGGRRVAPTHDLSLGASEIQVEHLGAVVRGHLQLFEGLLEQHGPAEPRLRGGDGEAFVDVDGQDALLPFPGARCGRGRAQHGDASAPFHPWPRRDPNPVPADTS